ncbi:MAG TPA: hypothetical protein VN936_03970 [Candidatus Acidoferrum sp.]|nr:hypothetical protein [Candidatus Acidoferrum sp.]
MPKAFSPATLGKFEDASASIPLRQLVRAFEDAGIRMGADPGGSDGARKVQFRRYVAGVDQDDPRQVDQLGAVLGALIDEVATSKQEFLVKAAESDGFRFAGGVFRRAAGKEKPAGTSGEAERQLDAACRTVLGLIGAAAPAKTADLVAVVESTLKALKQQRSRTKR